MPFPPEDTGPFQKRGAIISVRLDGGETVKPHHHVPPTWPAPIRALAFLSRVLAVVEGAGIGACLVAVVWLASWQCLERNLMLHHIPFFRVPPWTDGVIRHSVFMLGFLGGAYATYTGRHIRIDAVTRVLKSRGRMALRVVTTLVAVGVVIALARAALAFRGITIEESNDAAAAHELFTPSRGAMIIVFGYAVIAYHFLVQAMIDVCWLVSGGEPPPDWIAEAHAGTEVDATHIHEPHDEPAAAPGNGA